MQKNLEKNGRKNTMLSEKLSKYHSVIIEIKKIEKKIKDFFQLMATREDPKFSRCADYGERFVEIIIPFDEINLSLLTKEKITMIEKVIKNYRELRDLQKKLEVEIEKTAAIEYSIKNDINFL